jgi:serine/threonine protein kinase
MEVPPAGRRDEAEQGQTRTGSGGEESPVRGLGPYQLLRCLGEGGMGEVWLAEQLRPLRRHVAIKVIKAGMDTARVIARFDAERQALAVMDHPTIAKVFDGGKTPEGRPYFAMEYVRGEAITVYCNRRRLTIPERLELFIHLCEGVQHAHQKGIIHRDLKPSNVLVSEVDDHPVPRIIDFGIAKAIARPLTEQLLVTELGGFMGTPEYMSPEQAEPASIDIDTRSDVYSLGVMLYELLVGALPFDAEALRQAGVDELRRTIREKNPPRPSTRVLQLDAAASGGSERHQMPLSKLAKVLRGDLDWITMKALEKDRTRRYPTANALALDVRRHLRHEPVTAGAPSSLYRARKFARRYRMAVATASALLVTVTMFSAVTAIQARSIAKERDRANQEAATAKQVSDFLVGLFNVSDPSEARGNTLTAREILANGARQVASNLNDQPTVRARLERTIGTVYTKLGMYSEAEPLLRGALQSERRELGAASPETLLTTTALGDLLWYQRRYTDAEPLYLDVVEQRTHILGSEHPDTLRATKDLAVLYIRQKRFEEAERLLVPTLALQRKVLGTDHADTLGSMNNLQALYFTQGRFVDAEPLALRVLEGRRRVLGVGHPDTITATHNLATVYDGLHQYDRAEPLFREALDEHRRVQGPQHPSTANTLFALGKMYAAQGRYRDAELALVEAYDVRLHAYGSEHPSTQEVVLTLTQLYTGARDPQKTAEWRGKLTTDGGAEWLLR